jgi:putative membrane protein
MSINDFAFSWPLLIVMIFNILLYGLALFGLVSLIVWVVRQFNHKNQAVTAPLEIAKERYARGEVSQAEFEEIKKNIS